MKKQLLWCMAALSFSAASAQTYETRFARPLSDVLNDVATRFQVRLKYDVCLLYTSPSPRDMRR